MAERFAPVPDYFQRHIELRPESHNPEHKAIGIDLAKHLLPIDGVAEGALIGALSAPIGACGQPTHED